MPSEFAFRLSTYLTLALSCVCLGYAEWEILPAGTFIAGLVIVSLAVSFRAGERYEIGLSSANRVGFTIGVLGAAGMGYQFLDKQSLIYTLPWPSSLLPYLGPLLMVLMPAKMFRPKHVGDWWAMQGIGMAAVGLASSMAEDAVFGVLMSLYAGCGVWSLVLFYFRRTARLLPPVPHTNPGPLPTVYVGGRTGGRRLLILSGGWLLVASAVALPIFFATPRSEAGRWQFMKPRVETGYAADQMIDLNRTGDLRVNRDVAFQVRATNADGSHMDSLNPEQRWRGVSYKSYERGQWTQASVGIMYTRGCVVPLKNGNEGLNYVPPDLGPTAYTLTFTRKTSSGDLIVADPTVWWVGGTPPISTLLANGEMRPWWQSEDTSFRPFVTSTSSSRPQTFRQVTRPANGADPDLGPPFELAISSARAAADPSSILSVYRQANVPRIRDYARTLLETLAKTDPRIRTAIDRASDRVTFTLASQDFEYVARAVTKYFAYSGEYTYTTSLKRLDKSIDPIEEFLLRTKEGHCERFAAALALILRSVGIPTAYVLGFKGCEADGDGLYFIRQDHAHAWVEVLIPRTPPPKFPFANPGAEPNEVWHWLSLDPTPGGGPDVPVSDLGDWFDQARSTGVQFFLDFIVGLNPERQMKARATVRDWVERRWPYLASGPIAISFVLLGRLLIRFWRRRTARPGPPTGGAVPWFDHYLELLSAKGYSAVSGQTPAEHARTVAQALRADPTTASLADDPEVIVSAFYLVRYAGRTLSTSELGAVTAAVDRLSALPRHFAGATR